MRMINLQCLAVLLDPRRVLVQVLGLRFCRMEPERRLGPCLTHYWFVSMLEPTAWAMAADTNSASDRDAAKTDAAMFWWPRIDRQG